MKALSLLPKQLDHSVRHAFGGQPLAPILSVRLDKGEEKLAREVAVELMSSGSCGKVVTVHTQVDVEASERRMEADKLA